MSHDAEMTPIEPNATPVTRSAADRMRAHRERRRLGLRCLTVQLRETEIDVAGLKTELLVQSLAPCG